MSLSVSRGMVHDAAKELREAWYRVKQSWDDDTARAFEAEYLETLAPKIRSAVEAMEALSSAETRARRDCE